MNKSFQYVEEGPGPYHRAADRAHLYRPIYHGRFILHEAEEPLRKEGLLQDQDYRAEALLCQAQLGRGGPQHRGPDSSELTAFRVRPDREKTSTSSWFSPCLPQMGKSTRILCGKR